MQTNYNTRFETPLTHQSHSKPLEKDLCNKPPLPRKLPPIGPPHPLGISVALPGWWGGGGKDIYHTLPLPILNHRGKKIEF